jgi:CHAT domain-containing protein
MILIGTGSKMGRPVVVALGFILFEALAVAQPSTARAPSFRSLFTQATHLHAQGEFGESLAVLEKASAAAAIERNDPGRAKCLLRMGITKWDLGDVSASAARFSEAAEAFRKTQDRISLAFCAECLELIRLYDRGRKDRQAGLVYRAEVELGKAEALARGLGLPGFQLKCLRLAALTFLERGELDRFLEKSRSGLAIAATAHHRLEQGRCLNNIGVYHQQREDYAQAVVSFEQARAIFQLMGDGRADAECLSNLGLVYRELGEPDRASYFLKEALSRDREAGNAGAIAMDWANIGSVLLRQGLDEEDADLLRQALEAFQNSFLNQASARPDPVTVFTALNNMGVILDELQDYPAARVRLGQAMMIADQEGSLLERSNVLINIAATYLDEMRIDEAMSYYRSAHEISEKNSYSGILMESCLGLAHCLERAGDEEAALSFYQQAIEALEGAKARLPEPFLIGFSRHKREAYDRAIRIWADRYERAPSEAICRKVFDLAERARARAFLESLADVRPDLSGVERQRLQDRQMAISRKIKGLSAKLGSPYLSGTEKRAFAFEIECAEEESVRLSAALKNAGPSRVEAWGQDIRPLKDVQDLLREGEAVLLEYILSEPRSYLIRISPSSAELYRLKGRNDLERSLRAYRRSLTDRSLDPLRGFVAAERIGRELLPLDGDESFRLAKNLIIVPDGLLHDLPFEALRVTLGTVPHYLIDGPSISYCPSASALAVLKGRVRTRPPAKQVLAIGSPDRASMPRGPDGRKLAPLPFSLKELQAIARCYPAHDVDLLSGKDTREDIIKTSPLENYRIIHFACHGFLDEKVPLRSALALAAAEGVGEDGFLQMREIYGLRLSADLIVLSACQTAAGRLETSEGLLGLARPFFFAGARAVVASLWSIGDRATVPFMREFYKRISAGRPAAEALREAKLSMIGSRWSHPFYWAGFLLEGDPTAPETAEGGAGLPSGER